MKFWANSVVSFRGEVLSFGLFLQRVVHTICLQLWRVSPLGIAHVGYSLMLLCTHFPPNSPSLGSQSFSGQCSDCHWFLDVCDKVFEP